MHGKGESTDSFESSVRAQGEKRGEEDLQKMILKRSPSECSDNNRQKEEESVVVWL